MKLITDKDLTCAQLQAAHDLGLLSDVFDAVKLGKSIDREEVRKALGLEPLLLVYKVVVDYNLSLSSMIEAGKYDWTNDGITAEHFPVKCEGTQELEITLLHFDRYISSNDAIKKIDKAGYRPATLPELLTLGASQPGLQQQFPIVALGSVWQNRNGYRCVPYLWDDGSKRRLFLDLFVRDWYPYFRFAAVRK